MIEIRLTGVVVSDPREHIAERHPTKVCVRVNVIDAQGTVQWVDCRSTNSAIRQRLAKLRVGDAVEIKGNLSWVFYTKADGVMQGLQARVTVSVIRRLGSTLQHHHSKEAA